MIPLILIKLTPSRMSVVDTMLNENPQAAATLYPSRNLPNIALGRSNGWYDFAGLSRSCVALLPQQQGREPLLLELTQSKAQPHPLSPSSPVPMKIGNADIEPFITSF